MTRSARIVVDSKQGTLTITAPVDASLALLLGAARHAHGMAHDLLTKRVKAEMQQREMLGRAAVAELYARLGSWQRTTKAITGEDDHDPVLRDLVAAVQRFARSRLLSDDLTGLDETQVKRWARRQYRYASDDVYDDFDPASTPAPVRYWGEEPDGGDTDR